jgi:hypothetical protein
MELDPSQFLAQDSSDEESDIDDDQSILNGSGPPILTSLGLTHVNTVSSSNPYASLMVRLSADSREMAINTIYFLF